jgi:hypothetical protein
MRSSVSTMLQALQAPRPSPPRPHLTSQRPHSNSRVLAPCAHARPTTAPKPYAADFLHTVPPSSPDQPWPPVHAACPPRHCSKGGVQLPAQLPGHFFVGGQPAEPGVIHKLQQEGEEVEEERDGGQRA